MKVAKLCPMAIAHQCCLAAACREGGALATAARQMSMRLAKAYTFVTSAIMRVRSFRQTKADAYMQLDEGRSSLLVICISKTVQIALPS